MIIILPTGHLTSLDISLQKKMHENANIQVKIKQLFIFLLQLFLMLTTCFSQGISLFSHHNAQALCKLHCIPCHTIHWTSPSCLYIRSDTIKKQSQRSNSHLTCCNHTTESYQNSLLYYQGIFTVLPISRTLFPSVSDAKPINDKSTFQSALESPFWI